jgi:superfamily I DNA/RNA helicase
MKLTENQDRAAFSTAPITLVLAAPGSGKTRTAIARYQAFLMAGGNPLNAVILTFTNAAADELLKRLEFGEVPKPGFCGTLHAYALASIQNYRFKLGMPRLKIISEEKSKGLLRDIANDMKISITQAPMVQMQRMLTVPNPNLGLKAAMAVLRYRKQCRALDEADLDSVLLEFLQLIRAGAIKAPHLLIVDEYQDSAPIDAEIYRALKPLFLFVVGDVDQSIYTFRGATIENILNLEKEPGVFVTYLETNFRSTEPIIQAANRLITRNKNRIDNQMKGTGRAGEGVQLIQTRNQAEQAAIISGWLKGRDPKECAILTRNNFDAESLRNHLQGEHKIQLLRQPDQEAIQALLRAAEALLALPEGESPGPFLARQGFDLTTIRKLRDIGMENPEDLLVKVQTMEREEQATGEGIYVGTMHSAKGREWDHVAIADASQAIIPAGSKGDDLEDQRRLFYVAMTRARESLLISAPEMIYPQFCRGAVQTSASQFLFEIQP